LDPTHIHSQDALDDSTFNVCMGVVMHAPFLTTPRGVEVQTLPEMWLTVPKVTESHDFMANLSYEFEYRFNLMDSLTIKSLSILWAPLITAWLHPR
jgi:hypothetical protein